MKIEIFKIILMVMVFVLIFVMVFIIVFVQDEVVVVDVEILIVLGLWNMQVCLVIDLLVLIDVILCDDFNVLGNFVDLMDNLCNFVLFYMVMLVMGDGSVFICLILLCGMVFDQILVLVNGKCCYCFVFVQFFVFVAGNGVYGFDVGMILGLVL